MAQLYYPESPEAPERNASGAERYSIKIESLLKATVDLLPEIGKWLQWEKRYDLSENDVISPLFLSPTNEQGTR